MLEMLQAYEIVEIIAIIVAAAIALRGCVSFFDWAVARLRKIFGQENAEEKRIADIEQHVQKNDDMLNDLKQSQEELNQEIKRLNDSIDLLIQSDRDDIKSYITEKYHYFVEEKGCIDNYSLNCIEEHYGHYIQEDGNSFIASLMAQIRELPKSTFLPDNRK